MSEAYDILLGRANDLRGFRLHGSPIRDSAPLVAARFSTGSPGQSDLDLLKYDTFENLEGGMFQRDWLDDAKCARIVGVLNKYDRTIYPRPPMTTLPAPISGFYPVAKIETELLSFLATGFFNGSTTYTSKLYKCVAGGAFTSIALPGGIASSTYSHITGLCLHKKYLFVSGALPIVGASMFSYRYDIEANSWTSIGTECFKFFTLHNLLFCITSDSEIYSVTGEETASPTTTLITIAGSADLSMHPNDVIEFNGAVYIAKQDGIYRFDGTNAVRVLKLVTTQLCDFNGALYFVSKNWLFKFDGATLTRLQFFGPLEPVGPGNFNLGLSSNSDYLFINTVITAGNSGYANADKFGSISSALRRVYMYDGVGFALLNELATTVTGSYFSLPFYCNSILFDLLGYDSGTSSWDMYIRPISLADLFVSASTPAGYTIELTSSEHTGRFPSVYKSLERIVCDFGGMQVGDSIEVRYQLHDGLQWLPWVYAGLLDSTTSNELEITDNTKQIYKRAKIHFYANTISGSKLTIRGGSIGYTLQPRSRWRWQMTLMAEGDNTSFDALGNTIAGDPNQHALFVELLIRSKTPAYLLGHDYGKIAVAANAAALSLVFGGRIGLQADEYGDLQLIAILNDNNVWEFLRVKSVTYNAGTNRTTVVVYERGYMGITAAAFSVGNSMRVAFRVYVNRLLREAPRLHSEIINEHATGESQIQRHFYIEAIEV